MADRIIRDELLTSERWLDLPTDAARLAFVGFVLICDDFGNFEGGSRRLFRSLQVFTQMKTEEAVAAAIDALMGCDLIRRYVVDNREFFHIPRFKSHRQYLVAKVPASPWNSGIGELGKDKRVYKRGLAENVTATSHTRSNNVAATSHTRSSYVAEGVGVGVGVGEKKDLTRPTVPTRAVDKFKTVLKKLPQGQNQDELERNRRIAIALTNGNVKLAKAIQAGKA